MSNYDPSGLKPRRKNRKPPRQRPTLLDSCENGKGRGGVFGGPKKPAHAEWNGTGGVGLAFDPETLNDINTIRQIFTGQVENMTATGQRFPDPDWNNLLRTMSDVGIKWDVVKPYKGCGEQACVIQVALDQNMGKLNNQWNFEIVYSWGVAQPLPHQWTRASSGNVVVDLDPQHNTFKVYVVPKK